MNKNQSLMASTVPTPQPQKEAPELPANFPIRLDAEQLALVKQNLSQHSITHISNRDIVTLGAQAEVNLHRVLDSFLSRVTQAEDPRIFKLVETLKEAVDKEDLPALAHQILHAQPSWTDRLRSVFSTKFLQAAAQKTWEETRQLAAGKTKNLVDVIQHMDAQLRAEQNRLNTEISSLEQLKTAYQDQYRQFAVAAAFTTLLWSRSRQELSDIENQTDPQDAQQAHALAELKDKLQALESRALALEGSLTRLPADQLTIRQLQNAAITTLQETTTTAAARFASIKMTLLTIQGALVTRSVQQLAEQGAQLDDNLARVRATLMNDVVSQASNAPGDNRLAQARLLQSITTDTQHLLTIVEQARTSNQEKFAQARTLFAQVRQDLLASNEKIQAQQPLKY